MLTILPRYCFSYRLFAAQLKPLIKAYLHYFYQCKEAVPGHANLGAKYRLGRALAGNTTTCGRDGIAIPSGFAGAWRPAVSQRNASAKK
jgi:hypothetical protein